MRKRAVLFTLTALEVAGLALSAFFWFVMRRDLAGSFAGRPVPWSIEVAFSAWFVPMAGVAGAMAVAVAWLPRQRAKVRTWWAGAGLVCTVFALTFAIVASYAPAFAELGAPN
jgi:hypothetical protein